MVGGWGHVCMLAHVHISIELDTHIVKYCLFQGCAIGLGFCAAAHLDAAVSKLEKVAKEDMARKSSGLFGLVKVRIIMQYL